MYRNQFFSKTKTLICVLFFILASESLLTSQIPDKTSSEVVIDGLLDEPIWKGAKKFTNFIQTEPEIFAPSSVKSEFNFGVDSENIYIGGIMFQERNMISASNGRKDDAKITSGDCAVICIDPLNNGNSAYFFVVNPVNAQADGLTDGISPFDYSWDAVYISETKIDDNYWSFELKIPLTSINFQNKEVQTWGILFNRYYAQKQENSINQLVDKNEPFRVSDYYKIQDIKGLKKSKKFLFTPYLYGHFGYSGLNDSISLGGKTGGEIKYNPTPATTFIATFNPDYAQIETDKEVINVTDVPTTYPEKRPFFIESSDMYPHLAVNTRNISDINTGLKFRHVGRISKIDITGVYDKQKNLWGLGNIRLTDNKKFHFEVISGIKSEKTNYLKDYNYNVTLHGRLYFFKKKLQVYSLYGTINRHNGLTNAYEFINAVEWTSRTWNSGILSFSKSDYYNPDIVGSPALSNEVMLDSWLGYTLYDEKGFFRKTTFTSHLLRYDLFSNQGNEYFENTNELNSQLYMGNLLGNWELSVTFNPGIEQKFRFRNPGQVDTQQVFFDAISPFILVNQAANGLIVNFATDPSKKIGSAIVFDNSLIRKSKAKSYSMVSFVKIGPRGIIDYSINFLEIAGSEYQNKYRQVIHRIKVEYNATDKMNLRLIYQPNRIRVPIDDLTNENTVFNLTYSWEFIPGGKLFIVCNNFKNYDLNVSDTRNYTDNNQSLTVKFSKTF